MHKLIATLIALSICVCVHGAGAAKKEQEKEPKKEQSRHEKIYQFQHKVLPLVLFEAGGAFYELLSDFSGENAAKFANAVAGAVDVEFAKATTVKKIAGHDAVLITFPKPEKAPQCYYVIISNTKGLLRYITLEMATDILGIGTKTALCEWIASGQHLNRGTKKYTDAESFIVDALKKETN